MISLDSVLKQLPPPVQEFIECAYCQNRWLWCHALAGAICGKIGGMIAPLWLVMTVAVIVSVAWEIFEAIAIENKLSRRFIYDSIGDVSLELFLCWMAAG
jgi:hypothetical protein